MSYTRDSSKDLVWDENSNSYVSESAEPTTIAEAIAAAQQRVAAVYTAISNKGGTLPATQNLSNLPTAIESIPTPPDYYVEYPSQNGQLKRPTSLISLDGITSFDSRALYYAYYYNQNITGTLDAFSNITTLSGDAAFSHAFAGCRGITSVDFSNVTTIGTNDVAWTAEYMFQSCTNITSVDLSSLTKITSNECTCRYMFDGCTKLANLSLGPITDVYYGGMEYMFRNTAITSLDLSHLTYVGSYACTSICSGCKNLVSVDISSLENMVYESFDGAFSGCTSLTTVDLSSLKRVYGDSAFGYTFSGCTALPSLSLPKLRVVKNMNYVCQNCTSLTSVSVPSLEMMIKPGLGSGFRNCSSLPSFTFSKLDSIADNSVLSYCFQNCTSLISVSFPALNPGSFGSATNQFYNMLQGCTGVTVHFPSDIQSVIGNWSDVVNGFGGTNTTVLFDLPATGKTNVTLTIGLATPSEGTWEKPVGTYFEQLSTTVPGGTYRVMPGEEYVLRITSSTTPDYYTKTMVIYFNGVEVVRDKQYEIIYTFTAPTTDFTISVAKQV